MSRPHMQANDRASMLARFIASPTPVKEGTSERAKKVIVDTIAANLAGLSSEVLSPLLKYLQPEGEVGDFSILGTNLQTGSELAAMVNGTLSAALEFDDVLSMMPGHPSAVIVPALCASKAALSSDGRSIVEAYVVGIEVGARLAQAITLDHYKKGYHATGTLALFSAVAALARIERMDTEKIDIAFGIAASMSSGLQGNFGTMTKPLHSGWAARNALCAIKLAQSGLTASRNIFETEGGFFDAYGTPSSALSNISTIGNPWIVDEPGIALKMFPCCYATHRGIDALLDLKRELDITPDAVRQIKCLVPPGGLIPLKFAVPKTRFESLFSMPYALCMAMLHDRPRLKSFTEDWVQARQVHEMLQRIEVTEDPVCVADYPEYQTKSYGSRGEVRVMVETRDGRSASKTVRIAPGHPERELTWAQMSMKFQDCAVTAGFTTDEAETIYSAIKDIDKASSFGKLIATLNRKAK